MTNTYLCLSQGSWGHLQARELQIPNSYSFQLQFLKSNLSSGFCLLLDVFLVLEIILKNFSYKLYNYHLWEGSWGHFMVITRNACVCVFNLFLLYGM